MSLIQSKTSFVNASNTGSIQANSNYAAGDLLVLISEDNFGDGTATQISSISDGVNTWQRFTGVSTGADMDLEIWYAFNVGGGARPAITVNYANAISGSIILEEHSGVITTDPKDKSVAATGTSNSPASGNTPALSQADELIIGVVGWALAVGSASNPVAGYSDLIQENNGSGAQTNSAIASKVVSSTGAQSIGMSLTSASSQWGAICATFKAVTPQAPVVTVTGKPSSRIKDLTVLGAGL